MIRPGRQGRKPRPAARIPPGCPADSIVLTFEVPPELAGTRLDQFVRWRIPRLSRTRAQQIVRACAYRSDGSRRRPSELVRAGETVLLVRKRFAEPDVPLEFGVVFEDESVLVVDKPAGLPVHPSATYHRNTLSWLLEQRYPKLPPRIAHRLDRETSGVIVCGRGHQAERNLKLGFERRRTDKSYLAIVEGVVESDKGSLDTPMAPVEAGLHLLMEARTDGLPALTEYEVVQRAQHHTLLALSPRTGRQHQLRVHLAAAGHPIVGDKLYGPEREAPFLEYIETGMTPELCSRLGHHRHALHAETLSFAHPVQQERMHVRAPLASDLRQLWRKLGGSDPLRADCEPCGCQTC